MNPKPSTRTKSRGFTGWDVLICVVTVVLLRGGIGLPATSPTIKPIKGVLNIRPNDRIEWTKAMHNQAGNIGLADGSAFQATSMQLSKQFQAEINSTTQAVHRIALPE